MNRASVPTVSNEPSVDTATGSDASPLPTEPARTRWRLWLSAAVAILAFLALLAALSSGLGLVDMARWAGAQQRAFHDMVRQLLALDGGGVAAAATLIGACLVYGFAHAAIPGHGKFLIAGAGLASRMSVLRLVGLSLLASLAQAVTAIVLVYGSFAMLQITAGWAMTATDRVLIPASYLAIVAISIVLIRRAWKGLSALAPGLLAGNRAHTHHHHHHHADHDHAHGHCGCNHRHGPTLEEVDAIHSWRDALMLVVGIGLRPCTGAVVVLVAAWRIGLLWTGAAAAVAMALGTGAFISLVAISAVSARGATLFAAGAGRARIIVPLLQLCAGVAILLIALAFLVASVLPG